MLIIDDILLLPWKGLMGIFKEIQKQADQELSDPGKLREQLLEAQVLFEVDKITEKEYLKREKEIMARLNALEAEEEEGEREGGPEKHIHATKSRSEPKGEQNERSENISSEVLPPSGSYFTSGKERKISKD